MKRNLSWLVISILAALAMLLASCAPATTTTTQQPTTTTQQPAVTTTTTTTTAPTFAETKTTEQTGTGAAEVPKYGGTFNRVEYLNPRGFDQYFPGQKDYPQDYYQDSLVTGDYTKGPAGTNEVNWMDGWNPAPYLMTGALAESWDLPDPQTIIYHIRPGVHWGLDPNSEASRLMNGREFTANDVVANWERRYSNPAAYLSNTVSRDGIKEFYAEDKYTVVVRWKTRDEMEPGREFAARRGWGFQIFQYERYDAPEVWQKYGDVRDWRNVVGTGPYFLTDFVSDTSLTFKRNPNYWKIDPFIPENRLPYVETQRVFIIPDMANRLAALRTGKIDMMTGITWTDAESLWKTSPQLKWAEYYNGERVLTFRVDNPTLPFYKKEVRHALTMAVDYEGIVNNLYNGHAVYPTSPIAPLKPFVANGGYIPLKDLPADIQELFSYNPTKAKQILADAGYPNGFKTSVIMLASDSDLVELVAGYWAAIGVDLELQIKETGAMSNVTSLHNHPELLMYSGAGGGPFGFMQWLPAEWHNHARYDGTELISLALDLDDNYFDYPYVNQKFAEILPHLYDEATRVALPAPFTYTFWQPWVKRYWGEQRVGNAEWNFWQFFWVDMDLKAQMLGK
ncbi:MAG: ABC transporter substrate-binding protein [Chloroflexi bacterium]|nr:ABC transporter substrate-binding protein [Chloroflexota bacterium]